MYKSSQNLFTLLLFFLNNNGIYHCNSTFCTIMNRTEFIKYMPLRKMEDCNAPFSLSAILINKTITYIIKCIYVCISNHIVWTGFTFRRKIKQIYYFSFICFIINLRHHILSQSNFRNLSIFPSTIDPFLLF